MMQIQFNQQKFSNVVSEWVKDNQGYLRTSYRLDVAVGTLFRIANQKGIPSLDTFVKLCNAMQVSPNDFFEVK